MLIPLLFWTCLVTLFYVYVGYPLLIAACSRLFGRRATPEGLDDTQLPTVTLLIAAYNEESVIAERIENALELDYPREKLEILVASDGSSDDTNAIARRYADRDVQLLAFPQRRGKSSVVNDAMQRARGDVVMLSDANTMMLPNAARQLVRWFADPSVGTVCGRLDLIDQANGRNVDGMYWRYENFLKTCEGRLDAVLGANGAIYAMRKEDYRPIPADTLIDDFTIPLLSKLHTQKKIVYDRSAVAVEETAPDLTAEFRRRARIGTGGAQAISRLMGLLHPRHGWTALAFLSHKVLRWLSPLFLIGLLVSNLALLSVPAYAAMMAVQVAFYGVAAISSRWQIQGPWGRILRLPALFVGVNAALLVGITRWVRRQQTGVWIRTPRTATA